MSLSKPKWVLAVLPKKVMIKTPNLVWFSKPKTNIDSLVMADMVGYWNCLPKTAKAHGFVCTNIILIEVYLFTSDASRKSDRKKSIFEPVSNFPVIEHQVKLAMLGVAMNRKKTGLSRTGSLSPPENL